MDVSGSSLDRMSIYAALQASPEVRRFDCEALEVHHFGNGPSRLPSRVARSASPHRGSLSCSATARARTIRVCSVPFAHGSGAVQCPAGRWSAAQLKKVRKHQCFGQIGGRLVNVLNTPDDQRAMLRQIGADLVEELFVFDPGRIAPATAA